MEKIRTAIFIDGFNVYHALDRHKKYHKYKWLNFEELGRHYIERNDEIVKILYFTAYAYWYPDKVQRHKILMKALRANNIIIVLGKFKEKDRYCPLCCRGYKTHEEKQTDVNIVTCLFEAAIRDEFDKAIIISGDTDLIPAIKSLKALYSAKRIGAVIPIGRQAKELIQVCDFHRKMKETHLASSRFAEKITLPNGKSIECPLPWK